MKSYRRPIIQLICFIFLFMFGFLQTVYAQDIDIYTSGDVKKHTATSLQGTKPDPNNPNIEAANVINGTVKFSFNVPSGLSYDILRSDNGGEYNKLTDFPLNKAEFTDKYVFSGHTYYYILVVYDANGAVISNKGPFKAVIKEGASVSSKIIILGLDSPYALVNNVKYKLDVSPFLKDGRTMVPLRFISEQIGAQVEWLQSEEKITISLNGNRIILRIGKSEAIINGKSVFMDVPAMTSNGRTLIPIRFVSENLKLKVAFNNKTKQITLTSGDSNEQQIAPPTTQPLNDNERMVRDIVSSNKKYTGVSTQGSISSKYNITFTDFTQTGQFKGEIEWIGYNVTDDIAGYILRDEILFKQTARHQNNKTTPLDVNITMKIGSNNRVSGTWVDVLNGTKGTTWFEYTTSEAKQAKYSGNFDAKGFPTGKATVNFGDNITFTGEVKVEANNFIAIGVVTYPDGTKVIGRFVNGKPDGLNSIIYSNRTAYLIDFKYGKPIDAYVANTIPTYKADELAVYKAHEIEIFKADDIKQFQADTIEQFKADDIKQFKADDIQPYKAEMIKLYQAQPVEKFKSTVNIQRFEAEVAKLNPPGAYPSIPIGGFKSPNYMNPMVQAWTSHMMKLPYLINNGMTYSY